MSRRGMTLLEVIIGLAMISILSLSLFASLSIGYKARRSAWATVGPLRQGVLALDLIKEDLESALPPSGILAGEFLGQAPGDSLLFYTIGRDHASNTEGIRKVELLLSDNQLLRRWQTNLLSPTELEPQEEVLCRNVQKLQIRYYDGSMWVETWDSTAMGNTLPVSVEILLEIADTPHRSRRFERRIHLACGSKLQVAGGQP